MPRIFVILVFLLSVSQPTFSQTKPKSFIEFRLDATLLNSYARGNLDDWFSERTGDPSHKVDQGSPAFFGVSANIVMPNPTDAFRMAMGLSFILPASHALWGTHIYFGGKQEIVLKPQIASADISLRFRVDDQSKLYWFFTPKLIMGWVTGDYIAGNSSLNFTPYPSIGFGIAAGLDYYITKSLGVSLTTGLRFINANTTYPNPESDTGYSQPLLANGELMRANLSGFYFTIGVVGALK